MASPSRRLETRLAPWILALVLVAPALAIAGRPLPRVLEASAPAELFAAGRAQALLERVARRPHPAGSEPDACVRELLVEELRGLGLEPEELSFALPSGRVLTNLRARIPGTDPDGTVLCLAHHDSVPEGPGAGDDGVGVVSWLETLRALGARGWQPRNDVVLLLTDGEELGLLGAEDYAATEGALDDVKVVVNLEAIGNGGPAVLFELGPENGARVRLWAESVPCPTGTSLSDAVYGRMPNDTDLSVFLRHGIGGFNLALTSGRAAYHAAHDTPENLAPRSLQHMGASALALLERLGEADLDRLRARDVTFFDLLGRGVVAYPHALDLVVLVLALALAGFVAGSRACLAQRFAGPLGLVRECLGMGALLGLFAGLVETLAGWFGPSLAGAAGNTTSAGLLFAGLFLTATGREASRRSESVAELARSQATLWLWSLTAVLAALALRGAAFAWTWPLFLGALGQRAARHGERHPLATGLVLALGLGTTLLLTLPMLHLLVQLFALSHALVGLVFGTLLCAGAALFAPALRVLARGLPRAGPALVLLGLAAVASSAVVARVLAWRCGSLLP